MQRPLLLMVRSITVRSFRPPIALYAIGAVAVLAAINMWNDDRIRTVIEFFGAKGKKTCFFCFDYGIIRQNRKMEQ